MGLFDFLKPKKTPLPENIQSLFTYENVNRFFDNINYIVDPVVYFAKVPDRSKLREMYYDDEIASAIDTRLESCVSTPWTLEGGSDDANKFIYENLNHCVSDIIKYSWWAIAYGYSVVQIVYEQDAGKIWWSSVHDQPYDSFKINRKNELISAITNQKVEPAKWIHTVSKPTYYNTMGESLLAKVYYPYYFKCNGWDFYMKFLERWGAPFLHAKTDINNSELKKVLESLAASKRPTGVVTPKDVEINAIESMKEGYIFDTFTKAITDRINRIILGQTLTSSTGQTGSLALGQVHNEVRLDKKKSDCDLIAITVQKCVDILFSINGFSGDVPQFLFVDPKGLQQDRATRDQTLHNMGVRFNDKYYIENYDIDPEHFKVSDTISTLGFSIPAFSDKKHNHDCKFAEENDPLIKSQVSLENEMIALSQNAFSKEEIRSAIKSATSPKDLQDKLAILMEKDSGKFEDVLTKALYLAKIKGFVDGKESI